MRIDVVFTADSIKSEDVKEKNVVVIDVLRATSVMVTALSKGVDRIYVFESVADTFNNSKGVSNAILCGERNGLKVDGFNYGNSPLEYGDEVKNKIMYMTTSNGTKALIRSEAGYKVFIGSFLNLDSVIEKIIIEDRDTVIACAGTDGEFTMDDSLCAGIMVKKIFEKCHVQLTDSAIAMKAIASASNDVTQTLKGSKHYSYLENIGFKKDLEYCLSLNRFKNVPEYKNGVIKWS